MQPCPLQITACQMRSKSPCCPLASICMRAKAVHWLQTNAMVAPLVSQRLHMRLCCTNALPAVVPLLTSMMWPAFKDCWPRDLT